MHLARFPRISLGTLPTPLEPMPNLSKLLGGPNLFIKRDDCTGLASGGNKTRKLEFLMADALAQGADTVVTQGAVQTNHGRQTAAAAAKLGLQCEILLERRVAEPEPGYEIQGNVLFDRLLGAKLSFHPPGDMNALGRQHTEQLCQSGRKAYFIPGGGSTPIGALGYVNAALELLQQAQRGGQEWQQRHQAHQQEGGKGDNTGLPGLGYLCLHPVFLPYHGFHPLLPIRRNHTDHLLQQFSLKTTAGIDLADFLTLPLGDDPNMLFLDSPQAVHIFPLRLDRLVIADRHAETVRQQIGKAQHQGNIGRKSGSVGTRPPSVNCWAGAVKIACSSGWSIRIDLACNSARSNAPDQVLFATVGVLASK